MVIKIVTRPGSPPNIAENKTKQNNKQLQKRKQTIYLDVKVKVKFLKKRKLVPTFVNLSN
jgi:hypothetical protein